MYICGNCFQNIPGPDAVCPRCGYDPREERSRFPFALSPGITVHGRYCIGRVLGKGGFGITYSALDSVIRQRVAIKEFYPDTMASRSTASQVTPYTGDFGSSYEYSKRTFLEEARTMAAFSNHPNIVSVRDVFEENGTAYYVMEYVEGCNLKEYARRRSSRLSWDEVVRLTMPVMQALEFIHSKGYIHRDVTPDNIFVTNDNRVKLLDFGSARLSIGDVTRSMDVILKHGFAPREQYIRRSRQGPYTDIYSLAASMYYLATGKMVPDALERMEQDQLVPPSRLCAIPPHQEKALLKALSINAQDRFQTIAEFRNALTASSAAPAPHTSPLPWILGIGGAAALLVIVLLAVLLIPKKKPEAPALSAPPVSQTIPEAAPTAPEPTMPEPAMPEPTQPDCYTEAAEHCQALYSEDRYIEAVEYARQMAAEHPEEDQLPHLVQEAEGKLEAYALAQAKEAMRTGKLRLGVCALNEVRAVYDTPALAQATIEVKQAFGQHSVAAGRCISAVIRADGTLFLAGEAHIENEGDDPDVQLVPEEVRGWGGIVSVSLGDTHLVGLRANGTVGAIGDDRWKQCSGVTGWSDVVMVDAGGHHTVALTSTGKVLATGWHYEKQCDVDTLYTDSPIIAVAAGLRHTVALHEDGTVTATGSNGHYQCNVEDWTDIIAIACGAEHTVGLKADGSVIAAGDRYGWNGHCLVTGWADIDRINCGNYFTIGISSNGDAIFLGRDADKFLREEVWTNVQDAAGGDNHAAAITWDGRYLVMGEDAYGCCDPYMGDIFVPWQ